ncbi:MAG: UDP-3-O-(3-hydroxymyristoyl)glucosamine N-acyltransferase [Hyphomicrobiaceae bacterium]
MEHPGFFERAGPFAIGELARQVEAELAPGADPATLISDVKALSDATAAHVSFIDNRKYLDALATTVAGACLVAPTLVARVPEHTAKLVTKAPYRSFAKALAVFYPEAMRPKAAQFAGEHGGRHVHDSARVEDGVIIEPGAVIGREAQIGRGTVVAAGALIGYRVTIGRDCYIGPGATLTHALVGDRVIVHSGVRVGQDGFGFAMGAQGHLKVPQIGRVIIQDNVEIGANTAIDRGALKDTMIGEGTKIDNLVQIGHNVVIGRHCVIVGQVGIAGSAELGDFVVMGGHSGVVGHVKVGSGAQIAGAAHVTDDVPAGARMAGTPAIPFKEFARSIVAFRQLGRKSKSVDGEDGAS